MQDVGHYLGKNMRGTSRTEPVVKKHGEQLKVNLKETVQYLWPYLWDFKGRVILAVLALIGAKLATLLMPWALKHVIDGVDPSVRPEIYLPLTFLIFYGVLRFGSVFLGEIRDALFGRVTERATVAQASVEAERNRAQ